MGVVDSNLAGSKTEQLDVQSPRPISWSAVPHKAVPYSRNSKVDGESAGNSLTYQSQSPKADRMASVINPYQHKANGSHTILQENTSPDPGKARVPVPVLLPQSLFLLHLPHCGSRAAAPPQFRSLGSLILLLPASGCGRRWRTAPLPRRNGIHELAPELLSDTIISRHLGVQSNVAVFLCNGSKRIWIIVYLDCNGLSATEPMGSPYVAIVHLRRDSRSTSSTNLSLLMSSLVRRFWPRRGLPSFPFSNSVASRSPSDF